VIAAPPARCRLWGRAGGDRIPSSRGADVGRAAITVRDHLLMEPATHFMKELELLSSETMRAPSPFPPPPPNAAQCRQSPARPALQILLYTIVLGRRFRLATCRSAISTELYGVTSLVPRRLHCGRLRVKSTATPAEGGNPKTRRATGKLFAFSIFYKLELFRDRAASRVVVAPLAASIW